MTLDGFVQGVQFFATPRSFAARHVLALGVCHPFSSLHHRCTSMVRPVLLGVFFHIPGGFSYKGFPPVFDSEESARRLDITEIQLVLIADINS